MELTQEQKKIIHSTGNIKINAVAGSGKTSTIIEYAKARPKESRILYLAFNKSVKLEAKKKFAENGLHNVKVETAHSLAYRHVVFKHGYKVNAIGYRTNEIASILHLNSHGEKHNEFVLANHIGKFVMMYCNSHLRQLTDLNYTDTINDAKAKAFVKSYYKYILDKSQLLLQKMEKAEIEITHDFYLKKFQLSNPVLSYDYILFDEAQDASPAMLDVFLRQKATKVIVGDTHQQIYGWRNAVNSLEKADFPVYNLSNSFRFGHDIAKLAMEILKLKKHVGVKHDIPISGRGGNVEVKSKAIVARTNLALLLKAIEFVTEKDNLKQIYFEGNINSYTYADDGASLYDVLNLFNGKRQLIRDPLIKSMKDVFELEIYIDKTEDVQMRMMLEIVNEYGNEIPSIIKKIKEKHVPDEDKSKAEMIFSTVHRCKGMEYDSVQLANDFVTEKKLEKLKDADKDQLKDKYNEEINLLYVAITRARSSIYIPEGMMPAGFPHSRHVHVLKDVPIEISKNESELLQYGTKSRYNKDFILKPKDLKMFEVREKYHGAYQPWSPVLDEELKEMFYEGVNVKDIAKHFGRSRGAINARIKKLELNEFID
jgi:F-box protein 18 (helicase)